LETKPKLLIVSGVIPFPIKSGQQQRVFYTLKALHNSFDITFLSVVPEPKNIEIRDGLSELCDDVILLPSRYSGGFYRRFFLKAVGEAYAIAAGLKFSNFLIGKVELTPKRVAEAVGRRRFDLALFEYWHASDCVPLFREIGTPCVLDMHDILWESYKKYLDSKRSFPSFYRNYALKKYRACETAAWNLYDLIVAINPVERDEVRKAVLKAVKVAYVGMGTDLGAWPFSWEPKNPPRVGYYGGLGNPVRQREAMRCYEAIMPEVWGQVPNAELWIIGSDPPETIRSLQKDARVKVTGYLERIQDALRTMSVLLCPFSGTFGFRSRLIETMALGVPVVATRDAGYGMDLDNGQGILLLNDDREMAQACLNLLNDPEFSVNQSKLARRQVENKFSYDATYGKLPDLFLRRMGCHESGGDFAQGMLGR
jgi:glycosyltransferase involved in cell wall biosynthesis